MSQSADISFLLTDQRLSGSRRVSITIRPLRVAYLVHPSDPATALSAIRIACRLWGGSFHMLFPCPAGEQPEPVWGKIIERYDPDALVDLVGVSPVYLESQRDEHDRIVLTDPTRPDLDEVIGAPVFGALSRWKRHRDPSERPVTVRIELPEDHPLALPLAYRYGQVEPRPRASQMLQLSAYQNARLEEYLEVRVIAGYAMAEEALIPLVTMTPVDLGNIWPKGDPHYRPRTVPMLTRLGLRAKEPSYFVGAPPERDQTDEAFLRRVLVVGDPRSVPDLCLAWNLRAQRERDWGLPLWVAPDWLEQDAAAADISRAAWLIGDGGLVEHWDGTHVFRLVSASLSRAELERLPTERFGEVETYDASMLDRFFANDFRTNLPRHSVASFANGAAEIQIPDYAELADFGLFDRVGWTVQIAGYTPPHVSNRYLRHFGVMSRIASDGLEGFLTPHEDGPGDLLAIGTRSGWEIVQALARYAGYAANPSDKGRLTTIILQLLGGRLGLDVVASSLVYRLLWDMRQIVARQAIQEQVRRLTGAGLSDEQTDSLATVLHEKVLADGQFERQHLTWGQLKSKLGNLEESKYVVQWLVEHRILLRGYQFNCPNCHLRRWHPIGQLAETILCEGCFETLSAPVPVDGVQWRYRLNEIVALAIDQGVLPHLLAARRMSEWAGYGNPTEFLGYFPGVEFVESAGNGRPSVEIDIFAILAGRPVIAEMKGAARELTETQVDDLTNFAKSLGCSRIIYGAPTGFADVPSIVDHARDAGAPIHVEIWESTDLLDTPTVRAEDALSPEEYLRNIAGYVGASLPSRFAGAAV